MRVFGDLIGNIVANNWSRFVLIVWLFAAYVLMQSYAAKLSSIFTVDQLDFAFSEDYYVGHQLGSYVEDFFIKELHLNKSKLKSYRFRIIVGSLVLSL